MLRLAFIFSLFLGCALPIPALAVEETHTIAGQEVGFYFSGLDKPTLVLWHQFDLQTSLGIPAGRASWEGLLQRERGERLLSQYNILAIDHPWFNPAAAQRFTWRRFAQLVVEIQDFLRRRGLWGGIYTMGASAGGALAILHCDLLPSACQGVVAVGAYIRFDEVDVAALVDEDCFHGINLLALNSPGDGMASLQEHVRRSECANIGALATNDSNLHGMVWLLEQPANGAVWGRLSQFFGLAPQEEQRFKGGDGSAILLARAMFKP